VFDIYGSIEMGVIAWECEVHQGYHVAEDSVLLETQATAADGDRLLLTNLHNEAMPLIRYDQGDLAVVGNGEPCACGRRFRRLEAIQGRVTDSVLRPDGSEVPPFSVSSVVRDTPGVRRFQIVQDRPGQLIARIESDSSLSEELMGGIEHGLSEVMGPGTSIAIETVATLEPPPGVKFRLVESRLSRSPTRPPLFYERLIGIPEEVEVIA
jgi:phenylacetate-CoA ligase